MSDDNKKKDLPSFALGFILAFLFAPVYGMVFVACARKVWAWFLEPQYGEGPRPAAWYGIQCIFVLLYAYKSVTTPDPELSKDPVRVTLTRSITWIIVMFVILGSMSLVGTVVGWK
jgi:hypothetical protein